MSILVFLWIGTFHFQCMCLTVEVCGGWIFQSSSCEKKKVNLEIKKVSYFVLLTAATFTFSTGGGPDRFFSLSLVS